MHILKVLSLSVLLLMLLSCTSGGALTPLESFNAIKSAAEKKDSEAVLNCISESGVSRINRLILMIKNMRSDQLAKLSAEYGYQEYKLKNLRASDCISLYFFSDVTGVRLDRYFRERIISVDIRGSSAVIKVESGIDLDFVREGPYWKFDISGL